jgi:hypothetical protein
MRHFQCQILKCQTDSEKIKWQVSSEDAVNMARRLALEEGLMVFTLNKVCYRWHFGWFSIFDSLLHTYANAKRNALIFVYESVFFELWLQFLGSWICSFQDSHLLSRNEQWQSTFCCLNFIQLFLVCEGGNIIRSQHSCRT